jgi:type IV secretory pathway VirJ component
MKALLLALYLLLHASISVSASTAIGPYTPDQLSWGDFGTTEIYSGGTAGLELILTDDLSLEEARTLAAHLSQQGKLAAILSVDNYLKNITRSNVSCFDAATPLSVYAQDLQQHHAFYHFEPAVITGLGTAADYLFAMLSQTPKGVFRGAFSHRNNPLIKQQLSMPFNLCRPNPAVNWSSKKKNITLSLLEDIATPWSASSNSGMQNSWLKNNIEFANWLLERDNFERQLFKTPVKKITTNNFNALPLLEIEAQPQGQYINGDVFALIISGDGGWANIDKDIANGLAAQGIASVGWNSLEYFWEGKTPAIAGNDLQQVLTTYSQRWHKAKVILIGFSMGADVMPFMVNQLDSSTKGTIVSVNLLNPSTTVDFEFHLSGWLNTQASAPFKTTPELTAWSTWKTNCFYSTKEQSLCAAIEPDQNNTIHNKKLFFLPGDHHFNGNSKELTQLIILNGL